jgi:hypothetical protein
LKRFFHVIDKDAICSYIAWLCISLSRSEQCAGLKEGQLPSNNDLSYEIKPLLSAKQRQEIESRLASYSIPLQILQMVAEHCHCDTISALSETHASSARESKNSRLITALNDKSIILLQQIFLECRDKYSDFRLAVFMSSRLRPTLYKFVLDGRVKGESGQRYTFDVCVYDRSTGDLVALGMQNNDEEQKAANNNSLYEFLTVIKNLHAVHSRLLNAFYASSYGYEDNDPSHIVKEVQKEEGNCYNAVGITLLEYKHGVYFERKAVPHPSIRQFLSF